MKKSISFENATRYFVVAFALFASLVAPALLPMLASADQLTARSVQLSSSSAGATGVTYAVEFTPAASAAAFVVDFCSNTPLIGETCTAPEGLSLSSATTATAGFTREVLDANTIVLTGTIAAPTPIAVDIDNVTNPDEPGLIYARVVTYSNAESAALYNSTNLGADTVDSGSIAISINDSIGVSGAVLESITFCVSGDEIGPNCTNTETPVLLLGEPTGDTVALSADSISEGDIYAQISTNASTGAIVRLKSSAVGCGGLMRAGAPTACDIVPALAGGITAGQARFGVMVSEGDDTGDNPNGVFQVISGSGYSDSDYALNYTIGDASGVTSTYGDPFLSTGNAPANNKNVVLTFGASVNNSTPAGLYSADLSLIATGKF